MRIRGLAVILGLAMATTTAYAEPMPVPVPHVYISPTVGAWHWDDHGVRGLELVDRNDAVWGGRIGYSPIQAFSGEIVVLTGTNRVSSGGKEGTVRLTQVEFSFLVNFQALLDSRIYPFLDLGSGLSKRSGDRTVDEMDGDFDRSHVSFHLGGGLKLDLTPRLGLRGNVRDTFFTETLGTTGAENQVTVDAVEISAAVEYRLGWGRSRGTRRLR